MPKRNYKPGMQKKRVLKIVLCFSGPRLSTLANRCGILPHKYLSKIWAINVGLCMGLVFAMNLQAQSGDTNAVVPVIVEPKFSFSVKAGLNVAQIFATGSQGFNHFGFAGGLKFGYRFADKFSFDPEVLYNMKGAARNPNLAMGETESFSVDLDYVEIPMVFNFHFGKKAKFSFEFGPSIGFLVREKAFVNGGEITTSNSFNIYDISFLFGLNYYLPKGFGLNFRYMNSIAPIQAPNGQFQGGISFVSIGQVNSVLNLSLNYRFNLSKKVILENGSIQGRVFKEKPPKQKKEKKQKGNVIDEEDN
jgi:hypothetical protein